MWINEIFRSIDGEVNWWGQGTQSTFVRFSGCSLKCIYCDSQYAWEQESGKKMTVREVTAEVKKLGCNKVTITGGEPLEQRRDVHVLAELLHTLGYVISLETNGMHSIRGLPSRVRIIMDVKLEHDSAEVRKHIRGLQREDFVKVVIQNWADYECARDLVIRMKDSVQARFAFSPVFNNGRFFNVEQILEQLQEDKLDYVVLNIQLHKLLGVK